MQQRQEKKQKGKNEEKNGSGKRAKPSTPTQGIDAFMGEEEKNKKQWEEQKEETGSGPLTHLPVPFGPLLRPSWIILKPLHREKKIYIFIYFLFIYLSFIS